MAAESVSTERAEEIARDLASNDWMVVGCCHEHRVNPASRVHTNSTLTWLVSPGERCATANHARLFDLRALARTNAALAAERDAAVKRAEKAERAFGELAAIVNGDGGHRAGSFATYAEAADDAIRNHGKKAAAWDARAYAAESALATERSEHEATRKRLAGREAVARRLFTELIEGYWSGDPQAPRTYPPRSVYTIAEEARDWCALAQPEAKEE